MELSDFASRVIVALLLGMLIGFERQLTNHTAGIRTNMLICLGSCMFLLFPMIMQSSDIQRIASYIVSGVGFLCSGVIFKENGTVKGLNTAATLWCTAAIGILTSTGMYSYAIVATIVLITANVLFRPISRKVSYLDCFNEEEKFYNITVVCSESKESQIKLEMLRQRKQTKLILTELSVYNLGHKKIKIDATYKLLDKKNNNDINSIIMILSSCKGVKKIEYKLI